MSVVLKKSEKVKIKAQCTKWQGEEILDIRVHVIASKGPDKGAWIHTGKGVQIPMDKAEEFARRVLKMVKEHKNG